MAETKMVKIDQIKPYDKNPRDNSESIPRVAESIRKFGFLQPIVVDTDGVILAGHTRYAAAKSLGMTEVPVWYAKDLTPAQARAYRLADNKVSEGSKWVPHLLAAEIEAVEMEDLTFDAASFGLESSADMQRRKSWENCGKKCGLEPKISLRKKHDAFYTSFYAVGKTGRSIDEIKEDPGMVLPFAENLCDYLLRTYGKSLPFGSWCLCTAPRRRHAEGFHFATEICRAAASMLGLPFYEGAITCGNRDRLHPELKLVINPEEVNVILYDDVMTTGVTMRETRALLLANGHNVVQVVAIRNQ